MRSAWLVLLSTVSGALVGLVGCGGAGAPGAGSPLDDPPERELLVRLHYHECWTGGWEVAIYQDGRCRANITLSHQDGPIGRFEAHLGGEQLAQIRAAVRRAACAHLKRRYPQHGYDAPACWLDFWEDGKLRTVEYDPLYRRNPKAVTTFYEEAEYGEARRGLLWEALKRVQNHPVSAVALEGGATKSTYQVGEQVPVSLTLRSVGAYPVAVATLDCQEVIYGECYAALWALPGRNPPIEGSGQGHRSARRSFGGRRPYSIRHELSPEALADLDRFLILQPNEAYVIPWSPTVSADRRGRYNLHAGYATQERYDLSAINQALSARFAAGVCNWTSPRIDIVK